MRRISVILSMLMMALLMTGCKSKTESNSTDTDVPSENSAVATVDQFAAPKKGDTVAEIVIKDFGSIYVKFFEEAAPKAVENFITHGKEGYYDGLTFHRIIRDFMIQGGDPTGTGRGGESIWGDSFVDEFNENLQPYRGALCMANAGPNTNGSQFFLVQAAAPYDDKTLDAIEKQYGVKFDDKARKTYGEKGGTPWLYQMHTVFGQIYEGYEVLDQVAAVEMADARSGIPANEIIIDTVKIFEYE